MSAITSGGMNWKVGPDGCTWRAEAIYIAGARALARVEQTPAVLALRAALDDAHRDDPKLNDPLAGQDEATRAAGWVYGRGGIGSPDRWRPTFVRDLPEYRQALDDLAAGDARTRAENAAAAAEDRAGSYWY